MARLNVTFRNSDGHQLKGLLDIPDSANSFTPFALFAHCFTCSKNIRAAEHIARALTQVGIAVLRFDFAGLGESEGDFADTNFSSNVNDLLAASEYLATNYSAPVLLIGHSLGGTAILRAAADIKDAKAVVTIGSPARASHVSAMLASSRAEIERIGEATVELGGRPFTVKQQFLDDIEQQNLPESIATLRKALLIMHAPLDNIVEIENAGELFAHAKHPKSFVSLDKADHLLSRREDSLYAGRVIAEWASQYVQIPIPATEVILSDGIETVAKTGAIGYRTEVISAGHRMLADEPASVGGSNLGPTPYGLLASALASCTTMTLRMYADRKKLDLKSVSVSVTHAKIHATDCGDCESSSGRIDEFQRELTLEGELTDEQRQRLLEIADMCPVHRTLHGEVKVRTNLVDA